MSGPNHDPIRWRLGVVSFLNSRPLIEGLDHDPRVELIFDVPSQLAGLLHAGSVDAALVPVIDLFQPGRDWQIISDACIGCDGETLTVRVFSRIAPGSIRRLHVDGDSHTSVALARVIWREVYDRDLEIVPFVTETGLEADEAILLIGDKVVTNTLVHHDIQTDLGQAWKSMTSLPFVFAAWAAPRGLSDALVLGELLSKARDAGVAGAEMIAADFGPGMGWPVNLAKRYLTMRLKFNLGPRQRTAMARFFELAAQHQLVASGQELVFA